MIPDPFQNDDPLWQPFMLRPSTADFAMSDTTASGLRSWLRSDEVTKALNGLQLPPPRVTQGKLSHIPGFPN